MTDKNEFNDTKSYELGGDGSNGCILPTGIMIRCFFILSSSCHLYMCSLTNDIMSSVEAWGGGGGGGERETGRIE